MKELKPCPFCGKAGQIKEIPNPFRHGWIGCPDCRVYINWKVSPAHAAATWNKRKEIES